MSWLRALKKPANFRFDQQDFTVLDTETTGFNTQKDRILSVGLLRIRGGKIVLKDSVELLVRQERALKESAAIHGITKEQIKSGLNEKLAMERVWEFVGSDILVAHFASFDREMLEEAFKRQGLPRLENHWLDTMDIEVALYPECDGHAKKLTLDALLQKKSIVAVKRHTALGDAYSTALLLQQQLRECKVRGIYESNQLHGRRNTLL